MMTLAPAGGWLAFALFLVACWAIYNLIALTRREREREREREEREREDPS